ncbi:DUF6368 family protein [Streptomyces sp. NBC_01351]|uniref:DUF6368 family protein n=1 Tax=Streptomyces sp. NBC_01351 TaxID=2903833 RepID=UPI003FCCCC6C
MRSPERVGLRPSRRREQGLVVGAGCSGSVNHALLGHLTLALARRLDAQFDFDGPLGGRPSTQVSAGCCRHRCQRGWHVTVGAGIQATGFQLSCHVAPHRAKCGRCLRRPAPLWRRRQRRA